VPIIKPEVQQILAKAGLIKEPASERDNKSVEENLNLHGLDNDALAEALTRIALTSDNDTLRLRALETALKVKGALKEQPQTMPQVTIVIQGSDTDLSRTLGVNPIIFPRQSLKGKEVS